MADTDEDSDYNKTWKKVARAIIPLPQRSVLSIMGFLGVMLAYSMRICLSITIVSIVEPKHKSSNNESTECPFPDDYDTGSIKKDPIYSWDESLIGNILSSFFIGYVITHIPGGIFSDIWGGKYVLAGCVLLSSLCTVITPVSIIEGGPWALMVVRVLMGLVQGTLFPSINVLLASWIPSDERAFYGAVVFSSVQIGTVLGTSVPGYLMHHYHSWSIVYYVFGVIGVVWGILFILMCSSDPFSHPYISDKEREMLCKKIGIIHRTARIQDAPWLSMLKNTPLIALVIGQCGHDFGFFIMVNYLPKYMSDVLHYNIRQNGLLSSAPFIAMFIISIMTGVIADYIIRHDVMNLTNCRKLFTSLGQFLPAIGIMLASFAGCDRELVIISFAAAMGTMGFFYSGLRINGLDLSPRFAGTVMAYVNGMGAIMGIISPILVGILTTHSTVQEFRIAFWIAFILLVGTCVVYIIFASGEVQDFNDFITVDVHQLNLLYRKRDKYTALE